MKIKYRFLVFNIIDNSMNKQTLLAGCFSLFALLGQAQGWLPQQRNPQVGVRMLGCTYEGARLKECNVLGPESEDWAVSIVSDKEKGGNQYIFEAKRAMQEVGVAVAFDQYPGDMVRCYASERWNAGSMESTCARLRRIRPQDVLL